MSFQALLATGYHARPMLDTQASLVITIAIVVGVSLVIFFIWLERALRRRRRRKLRRERRHVDAPPPTTPVPPAA